MYQSVLLFLFGERERHKKKCKDKMNYLDNLCPDLICKVRDNSLLHRPNPACKDVYFGHRRLRMIHLKSIQLSVKEWTYFATPK